MHAPASAERRIRETRETRAAAREEKRETILSCLSRLAPSVTRVVIYVSPAFCLMDQEKGETACSMVRNRSISYTKIPLNRHPLESGSFNSPLSPQMKLWHFLWIDRLKRKLWHFFFGCSYWLSLSEVWSLKMLPSVFRLLPTKRISFSTKVTTKDYHYVVTLARCSSD